MKKKKKERFKNMREIKLTKKHNQPISQISSQLHYLIKKNEKQFQNLRKK